MTLEWQLYMVKYYIDPSDTVFEDDFSNTATTSQNLGNGQTYLGLIIQNASGEYTLTGEYTGVGWRL